MDSVDDDDVKTDERIRLRFVGVSATHRPFILAARLRSFVLEGAVFCVWLQVPIVHAKSDPSNQQRRENAFRSFLAGMDKAAVVYLCFCVKGFHPLVPVCFCFM